MATASRGQRPAMVWGCRKSYEKSGVKMSTKLIGLISMIGLAVFADHSCFAQGLIHSDQIQDQKSVKFARKSLWTRSSGVDWPAFLGLYGDGKSPETGILKDWSDGKLKAIWKRETGAGYGMGSVAGGRFYHFGLIDAKATLICINAQTGKDIWKFAYESDYDDLYGYDSGPRASPVISDGRVYIYGVEGQLHCLDAYSGELIWDVNLSERFGVIQNFFGVASTPVVYEDLLLVMVGGSPEESKKAPPGALDQVHPNGSGIVALDKVSGEVKFKCVNDLASYSSLKLAQFKGQPLLLALMRGALFGVKPGDGKVAFQFPWRAKKLESVNAAMPLVTQDHVLISECYEIGSALLKIKDLESELVWSDRGKRDVALKSHWCTPIVSKDLVYGCSGRNPGTAQLRCIDWRTGKVNWSKKGLSRTSLTMIDGHLIVLGEDGELMLVKDNKDKFELVTRYQPGENGVRFQEPCWAAPIVSHGLLFVRGKKTIACFDLIPETK